MSFRSRLEHPSTLWNPRGPDAAAVMLSSTGISCNHHVHPPFFSCFRNAPPSVHRGRCAATYEYLIPQISCRNTASSFPFCFPSSFPSSCPSSHSLRLLPTRWHRRHFVAHTGSCVYSMGIVARRSFVCFAAFFFAFPFLFFWLSLFAFIFSPFLCIVFLFLRLLSCLSFVALNYIFFLNNISSLTYFGNCLSFAFVRVFAGVFFHSFVALINICSSFSIFAIASVFPLFACLMGGGFLSGKSWTSCLQRTDPVSYSPALFLRFCLQSAHGVPDSVR